jgi:glycosyltransferase involved in cell wall biosynthesis
MRILLINQFFYPDEAATSQFLTDLAVELSERGHAVEVICGTAGYFPGDGRELDGVAVHRIWSGRSARGSLPSKAFGYLAFLLGAACKLGSMAPFDVVVTLSTPPMLGLLGVFAKRRGHGAFIFWVQDVYPEIAERLGVLPIRPIGLLFESMMTSVYAAADRVVVLGDDMKRKLSASYPVADKTDVVHHWAVSEWDGDRQAARRRLGWDRDFVLLYSGNLGRAHDLRTFLEAFRIFSQNHSDARLVLPESSRCAVAEFCGASTELRINLLGHRPRVELAEFLACADIHLASQRPEVDGLVVPSKIYGILESGRPLSFVGSPAGEVAGMLERFHFGIRVEPGDAAGLASAWERLRRNPAEVTRMGNNARKLARGEFSRQAGLSRLAGLIEESWKSSASPLE